MKRTWVVVGLLVVALLAVEQGLERSKEKREEDRTSRISDLRATRLLPQYIASLFMGSFRAVAVDALWVELGRMRQEEHRYFEAVELMDMISSLQPRNPEVWAYQGWDAAFNIAANVRDPEAQWTWIRYGLTKLREGTRQLPEDPHLKNELGNTLLLKATIEEGTFQRPFMTRLEGDAELQKLLSLEPEGVGPLNCFELAIPWFRAAKRDLEVMKREQRWRYIGMTSKPDENRDYHTTQVGLNIHPSSLDGSIYRAMYFNACYHRRRGEMAEAARLFREAAEQARYVRRTYQPPLVIYEDYAALCDGMAGVCGQPSESPEERLSLVQEMTRILKAAKTTDYYYLSRELSVLKRRLGGDEFEYDDDLEHAQFVSMEKQIEATIAPAGDIDVYGGYVAEPEPEAAPDAKAKFPPHRVGFLLKKDGDVDLKATLWTFKDRRLQPTATLELRENRWAEIEGIADAAGQFMIFVEALDPAAKGRKPAYRLQWSLVEAVR